MTTLNSRDRRVTSQDMKVLSQLIDEETGGIYRIRKGSRVYYISIAAGVFDDDTMCRPYLLYAKLPEFPPGDWTKMRIIRDNNGCVQSSVMWDNLPAIEETWHPTMVDLLALPEVKRLKTSVYETVYNDRPAIIKIACFEWQMRSMRRETAAYANMAHQKAPCPAVLAHLTENDRVMGILLERLVGRPAGIEDLDACRRALQKLHDIGMIHGDVNRYNFIIDGKNKDARLVDFEHAEPYNKSAAAAELQSLQEALKDTTRRGMVYDIDR